MKSTIPSVKIIVAALFILRLCAFDLFGQAGSHDSLVRQFEQYQQNTLQEKIFVHTDKNFYLAGEIMWYKLYNVDGTFHKPLSISKVAYLEVLDKEHKPVVQAKIGLQHGKGNGSFYLSLSVNSGYYTVRAYTNWMKNFAPEYYFEKTITIVNTLKSLSPQTQLAQATYDIQFFPEGGNLVKGIESKIAFQVMNQYAKGMDCKGVIINQRTDTVARFQPAKFGIGHFSFTPLADHHYKAIINMGNGQIISKDLPVIHEKGYVMQVENTGSGQIKVKVNSNIDVSSQASDLVYLFAHTRQEVHVTEVRTMREGKAEFLIDTDKLGEGISHLTIFNNAKQPVCARLYFNHPKQKLLIDAKTDQIAYTIRKKVDVNIITHDQAGSPQVADMSMAVYLLDSLQTSEQNDIYSYLWLSSDLKGTIESPGYYFSNSTPETDLAMDNLMLTHGWRRFRWEDIIQNKYPAPAFIPEYLGHIITGKITNNETGAPPRNIPVYLSVPGKRVQLFGSTSHMKGHLSFNTKDFFGTNEIIIQTNMQKDSVYQIIIESPFSNQFSASILPAFHFSGSWKNQLVNHSISMQVRNVYAGEKSNQFRMPIIDTTVFYGQPDKSYLLDDFTRFPTIEEVMREYVPDVAVRRRNGKLHFLAINTPAEALFMEDPLILLDGLPVFNNDKIFAFDPLKIKKLEVVARRYFLGPLIFDGIVNFTTYAKDLAGFEIDPRALIINYEGFQLQREFYSPAYETENQKSSRLPDLRNLLFWSPDIITDETGKKQLNFYTSDQPGKYIGIIQGLTKNGQTGSQVFSFEVKEQL